MQISNTISSWLTGCICLSVLLTGCATKEGLQQVARPAASEVPVRGVWIATVANIDWPSAITTEPVSDQQRIRMQQEALSAKLDKLVQSGINTVWFQVKPDGGALYHSTILPWSDVMTGVTGKYPGYDPLAFMLTEAHKRGLKVHAWLNPYRVSVDTKPETVHALNRTLLSSPTSVYAIHRDWIRTARDRFVLDPGLPEVRRWITGVVAEVVSKYDIDGVQFDDYFYDETPTSLLDDNTTYLIYGQGFADKASWRRNNTLLMVKQVSSAIKALKPGIEFGISPAGVWRNKSDDAQGSETQGMGPAYDKSYADTRQWVQLGLLDYIAPQLYWPFERKIVRYDVLAKWWADVVRPVGTKLYIGVALYKVNTASAVEPEWSRDSGVPELKRQLDLNDMLPEIKGTILFSESYFSKPQTKEATDYLKTRWHPGG